jgi:hypothetical protein
VTQVSWNFQFPAFMGYGAWSWIKMSVLLHVVTWTVCETTRIFNVPCLLRWVNSWFSATKSLWRWYINARTLFMPCLYLKHTARQKPVSEMLCVLNRNRTMDNVQKHNNWNLFPDFTHEFSDAAESLNPVYLVSAEHSDCMAYCLWCWWAVA